MFAGHVPVSSGALWSLPLTLIVGFGSTVFPYGSCIVYVLVIVHPQLSVDVFASVCETVIPLQSSYNASTASLLNNSLISAFAKQLF